MPSREMLPRLACSLALLMRGHLYVSASPLPCEGKVPSRQPAGRRRVRFLRWKLNMSQS